MSPAIIEPDCVIELDTITLMKGELCLAVQSYCIRLREARRDEVLPRSYASQKISPAKPTSSNASNKELNDKPRLKSEELE